MGKDRMPENYKVGVPRVSDIVSSVFPFSGTESEQRFLGWLNKYGVSHSEYMKEASTGGTYVHSALEDYMLEGECAVDEYSGWVNSGKQFLEDYSVKPIHVEHYVCCNEYQGTADLIAEVSGEKYVLDWKNWGLAKAKFGIPQGEYRKPYDKLKKAQLQLSMYAVELGISKIAVIELREDGYYFYEMEVLSQEEIDKIIEEYKKTKNDRLEQAS